MSDPSQNVHEISINALDGTPMTLGDHAGHAVLVVNVASRCGLTGQYSELEQLQQDYAGRGFTVLGVPCNQFMGQEPGTPAEIAEFCSTTYGVTFPLTEKVEVNGEDRHALYTVLCEAADADGHRGDIRWNFEKFLLDADGKVSARFAPQVTPMAPQVIAAIEAALPG
jgi:glutathione peroxidase